MRIVRPTEPPSMTVIVDTIVSGEVELPITPAHPIKSRIDIVFAREGTVGVLAGTPTPHPALAPVLAIGMREIARIHVPCAVANIWSGLIEERTS